MFAFIQKFWKWILAGLAAVVFSLSAWQIHRMKKKIKLLELDKFVLETEAKNTSKKIAIMMDKEFIEITRKEVQRLLTSASDKGLEIQKLEQELKNKMGVKFKDWDSLERAAKGPNGTKP